MSGVNGRSAMRKYRKTLGQAGVYAGLLSMTVIFLFPILWILGISFKTRQQIFTNPPLFFWEPTLQNYQQVLKTAAFFPALFQSLLISGGTVLLSLVVGAPAAYAMARIPFRGRTTVYYSLLMMRMLPPMAVLIPMFFLFDAFGLKNSSLGVILAYTTFSLPLVVWVMRNFFEELPVEIEESAAIDGASRWTTFLRIVLPLSRPGLVAIGLLSLLMAWNDFLFAAVLTNNATQTLPVLLASYSTADSGVDWGQLAAAGMLVVSPVLLISVLAQRHLVAGLSAGSVKG
ncbi:carbohydrate ABC transporter permease (plasmid) [Mesorhizobium sp. B2-1-8]|uniref:carbohydrate ABC transporter permease n=1 Tax=Mesorhizobium sp. B2-1-8 TaxID=2589967 RepID=UPI0015E2DBDA|nr:carbohydrate ABC transporter permease [Mesorhizobium sp. B2-1-8]UCI22798.1 carbohydrate ABC transporter permease [Mesorhizobium sp. B2-1-8]